MQSTQTLSFFFFWWISRMCAVMCPHFFSRNKSVTTHQVGGSIHRSLWLLWSTANGRREHFHVRHPTCQISSTFLCVFFLYPSFSPWAQVVAVATQPVCLLQKVYFCTQDTQRCEGKSAECWIFDCDWALYAFQCPSNALHFPQSWINQLQPLQHAVRLSATPTFVLLVKLESRSAQQQTNPDSRRAPEIAPLL